MIGNWKKETLSEKPSELQLIASGIYMERKNIHEVYHEGDELQDGYTAWECDSRDISVSDYNLLKSFESIRVDEAIDNYTLQLIEEGVIS